MTAASIDQSDLILGFYDKKEQSTILPQDMLREIKSFFSDKYWNHRNFDFRGAEICVNCFYKLDNEDAQRIWVPEFIISYAIRRRHDYSCYCCCHDCAFEYENGFGDEDKIRIEKYREKFAQ